MIDLKRDNWYIKADNEEANQAAQVWLFKRGLTRSVSGSEKTPRPYTGECYIFSRMMNGRRVLRWTRYPEKVEYKDEIILTYKQTTAVSSSTLVPCVSAKAEEIAAVRADMEALAARLKALEA